MRESPVISSRPPFAAITRSDPAGRWLMLAAGLMCSNCFVGPAAADDRPHQFREPKEFWLHQMVFQKRGIVVEDDDYIVRQRYWVLDHSVSGQVVQVDATKEGPHLTVRFNSMGAGWQTQGVNIRNRTVSERKRSVTIRDDPYSDGVEVEMDEVTFSHTIEGDNVEPHRCGLIVRREGDVVFVRFPSSLISLVSPRVGDRVIRSFDWHDGFADGGSQAVGADSAGLGDCCGIVERERDEKGFIDVRWERTGRRKRHRFDNCGYYDVRLVNAVDDR